MKEYKIKYSKLSNFQLNDIYNYLSYKFLSETASQNIVQNIRDKIQILKLYPRIGTKIEDAENEYRIVVKRHIVLYEINENTGQVIINEVAHKLQNRRNI